MRFPEADITQLLETQFDQIESLWEADPYQEALSWALVIKEFMKDHALSAIAEGLAAFKSFKLAQAEELSRLGLGPCAIAPARLAPLAA